MEPAPAVSSPRRASAIRKKIAAGAVLAVSALLFYYATHIPVAEDVPARNWKAAPVDEVVLGPLATGLQPLISIEGIDNEGIDVRFEDARLKDESARMLRSDFKLDVPVTEGPITWLTAQKGGGHTTIDIAVEPLQGNPEVRIAHIGEGAHPGMRFSASKATLIVQLAVIMGDSGAPPEQKNLQIAKGPLLRIPGAIPMTLVVPEGHTFAIIFPVEKPGAILHLGNADDLRGVPGVPLRYLGIRRSASESYSQYACAAKSGARFWEPRRMRVADCAIAPSLRVTRFELASDSMSVALAGTAFVANDGTWVTDDWFKLIEDNKPLAAFLALVFAALAKWVWGAFFPGANGDKASEPSSKPG